MGAKRNSLFRVVAGLAIAVLVVAGAILFAPQCAQSLRLAAPAGAPASADATEAEGFDEATAADEADPDISRASIQVKDQTYTGAPLEPAVTVELDGTKLKEGTDYELSFKDNVEPGTASVTVRGLGDYFGTATAAFAIKPHAKGWAKENGDYHYYTASGVLERGAFEKGDDGYWYYLDENGDVLRNGWAVYQGKYFYAGESGRFVTNGWVLYEGKYYYMDKNGNPAVNAWAKSGGKYYYLGADGHPMTESLINSNGSYYYLDANGNPVTNYVMQSAGKYYYFNNNGKLAVNQWVAANGTYYYFGSNAAMVTGLVTINGEAYIFNNDGSLRHISNNSRLDRIVCKIIRDYTGFDTRKAYDYVAYGFNYLWSSTDSSFANWEEYYALNLVDTSYGNCFGYSALYHFLLTAMGYSSKTVPGTVYNSARGMTGDHCWVEVYINGQTYICDPVLEYAYGAKYNYAYIDSYFTTYEKNAQLGAWLTYVTRG